MLLCHYWRAVKCCSAMALLLLAGCATEYHNFGRFDAQNSAGEPRQVRVSWSNTSSQASPIVLETQCSERPLAFYDVKLHKKQLTCGQHLEQGIVYCGEPGRDLLQSGEALTEPTVCGRIASHGSEDIREAGGQLSISLYCKPALTSERRGEKKKLVNLDYLAPSVVPYEMSTRRVVRYSLNDKPPELSDNVCEGKGKK